MSKLVFGTDNKRPLYFLSLVVLLFSFNHLTHPTLPQLQRGDWSLPETIPGYDAETWPPILVADQNRAVHAFTSQWVNTDGGRPVKAILYSQWSADYGWTEPIDILLSPVGEARVTDAYLDNNGMIHVVFWGGDGTNADIYYSEAMAVDADNALSWSAPLLIGENAGDPEAAVIAHDDQGNQFVVFSGREGGNGIYVVHSTDGGQTWSEAIPIFESTDEEPNIAQIHVVRSKSGWLHAIWNVYSVGGQGRGVYYSRSKDGIVWSEPLLLESTKEGLGTQTPTLIEYNSTLYAIYNVTPKIVMRQSLDDGLIWDDPVTLFPRHVGVNGSLSLVIDGSNSLHLFFGQRITGNPDIHGMWHSTLVGGRWSEPDAVVKGPRIVDKEGYNGFDPYEAHAVVSQGNVILVTWRTDPGDIKDNGVWFSYNTLNAPELPVATLQSEERIVDTVPPSAVATPTEFSGDVQQTIDKDGSSMQSPFMWIFIGAIVAGIVMVVYIILFRRTSNK